MSASLFLSLASSNERLTKVPTVTSYQLYPFLPLFCHYVSPSSINVLLLSLSLCLWLQGMKDLSKFPQLPVTSYTLSSLYLATVSPNHLLYSLASSNERLTKVSTITSLDSCRLDHLSLCSSEECPTYHNFHNYQFQVQLSQCFFHIANGQTVKIIITKLPSYRVTKLNFISMLPALPLLIIER